jgi:deazaflavin-dependent oxidoreductase (nitroreductase family)
VIDSCAIERQFFRLLNRMVEPPARAGWASPRLVPGGVIVLETIGRKSGRRFKVPLAAVRFQGHTLVSTFRGRRSQWISNLAANPQARFWLRGRARNARAVVVAPGLRTRTDGNVPAPLRWLVPLLETYTRAGWAFAILSPAEAPRRRVKAPRPRHRNVARIPSR